jgi:ABC-2 type transport system ATP-binding protein
VNKLKTLEINNLTKKFGTFIAVNNLSLNLDQGEVFGLLGHNGAGKTTTINIIVGLLSPTLGSVKVNGHDVEKEPLEARRDIGLLPDNVGIYPNLTAKQNLLYFSELAGVPKQKATENVTALLELVKLGDWGNVRAEKFSRGMKQRLGIAQSLVRDPKLLLFDEPTLGIDPEGTRDMRELITNLAKERGKTILMTTHLLHDAGQVCDHIGIMKKGELIASGTLQDLRVQIGAGNNDDLEELFIKYQGVVSK